MTLNRINRFHVEKTESGLRICGAAKEDVVLLEQRILPRPHLHPLRPMDGVGVLTEDSPGHHPWQHGLYCALHGVGDSDFWFDPGQRPCAGAIETTSCVPEESGGGAEAWRLETAWHAHDDGRPLLRGTQCWRFAPQGSTWLLMLEWRLRACEEIRISEHLYGGLFLRMPYHESCNASAFNSVGHNNGECEQKDAEWVALTMNIDGRENPAGFIMSQHPDNAPPHRWRLDGQFGLGPVVVAEALDFKRDENRSWRYGLTCIPNTCSCEEAQSYHESYLKEVAL